MTKFLANSLSLCAALILALPLVMQAPQAQAKKLNWNEIQECIYLPFDMAKVKKELSRAHQKEQLPVLINQYENECKRHNVSKRDYEIVCSIPSNTNTAFCAHLHARFAQRK